MGMSAAQARLLSITARLTDNELRSQMITNSKLRLADQSSEASDKYMDALNSQQLMYSTYNDKGDKTSVSLTPNTLLTYSDLKNQYVMVNSSGKIIASDTDIKNYEKSSTLDMFLSNYIDSTVANEDFYNGLENIYGEGYSQFFTDNDSLYNTYNSLIAPDGDFMYWFNAPVQSIQTIEDYNNWKNSINLEETLGITDLSQIGGIFGELYSSILDFPVADKDIPKEPVQDDYKKETDILTPAINNFITSLGTDWDSANSTPVSADAASKILKSLLPTGTSTTSDGETVYIPGYTTQTNTDESGNPVTENVEREISDLNKILNDPSNSNIFDDITQTVVDLYYLSTLLENWDAAITAVTDSQAALAVSQGILDGLVTTEETKQTDYNNKVAEYEAAEDAYNTALEEREAIEQRYDDAISQAQANKDLAEAKRDELQRLKEQYEGTEYEDIYNDLYDAAVTEATNAATALSEAIAAKTSPEAEAEFQNADAAIATALADKNTKETAMNTAQTDLETAKSARETYENGDYKSDKDSYDAALAQQQKMYEAFGGITDKAAAQDLLKTETADLISQISECKVTETVDDTNAFTTAHTEWENEIKEIEKNLQTSINNWKASVQTAIDAYKAALDEFQQANIPMEVLDEKDSKYQWYKNLWYRMGGGDKDNKNYVSLEKSLLNNSEWLQFALEQGIITLEQATFNEDGSTEYPEMGTYDWVSISYTAAGDITSKEDEVAIAKAEVEYENALREIENQDKKYDQDLKNLDSQHSALQTEYDSIKSVIDKNVERSFKAFS